MTKCKYQSSRKNDIVLDLSSESRFNTINDACDLEEEKDNFADSMQRFDDGLLSKDNTNTPVAHIVQQDHQYWIYSKAYYNPNDEILDNPEERIWFTIRDFKNSASSNGYKLQEGDILKFGRARVKVVKISHDSNVNIDDDKPNFDKVQPKMSVRMAEVNIESTNEAQSESKMTNSEKMTCRIGFVEAEDENPLISVGKCSGSMKFIHQKCLAGWIDSKKIVSNTDSTITFLWKSFEGELCKETYSEMLQAKYNLITYENPFEKYVILEGQCGTGTKNIYIINLDVRRTEFKIGRGHESDIRISDISVSRLHATIKRDQNDLVVHDCNSKFGTLAVLKKPIGLTKYNNIHLQIGRSLIHVYLRDKVDWSLNGGLWLNQDNTSKPNTYKGYLGSKETSEDTIPDDFVKHLKKNKQLKSISYASPKRKIMQIEKPFNAQVSASKKLQFERLSFEDKQYGESCPDLTCELHNDEVIKRVRVSL